MLSTFIRFLYFESPGRLVKIRHSRENTYILLDVLLCSIVEYMHFYELFRE